MLVCPHAAAAAPVVVVAPPPPTTTTTIYAVYMETLHALPEKFLEKSCREKCNIYFMPNLSLTNKCNQNYYITNIFPGSFNLR
jgi:hypothetical protein